MPYALIDWEYAGPVDPLVELAQACWLNAKLHDDVVAEIEGLPSLAEHAQQLRAILDGYELPLITMVWLCRQNSGICGVCGRARGR
mgnify:CR=1 FL=1